MVAMICTEDIPGHTIEALDITTRVLHDTLTPILIVPTMTPHIADCLHTEAHRLTHRIRAASVPIQHTNK